MYMPKVTETQRHEKLREQLADLKAGKEVSQRKMNVALTPTHLNEIDVRWNAQLELRDKVKARTKEQQQAAGYKTKREVQIEVYEEAINELNPTAMLRRELDDLEKRRAKIFMKHYTQARKDGKEIAQAESMANNELTRAHIRRYDGADNSFRNKRDKEVNEMELALKKMLGIKDESDEDDT